MPELQSPDHTHERGRLRTHPDQPDGSDEALPTPQWPGEATRRLHKVLGVGEQYIEVTRVGHVTGLDGRIWPVNSIDVRAYDNSSPLPNLRIVVDGSKFHVIGSLDDGPPSVYNRVDGRESPANPDDTALAQAVLLYAIDQSIEHGFLDAPNES